MLEQKGDYVGALKGNQGSLSSDAEALLTSVMKAKIKSEGKDYFESSEKSHGQIEIRHFYMYKAKQTFNGKLIWKNLRNFICYEKYICNIITGKETTEI